MLLPVMLEASSRALRRTKRVNAELVSHLLVHILLAGSPCKQRVGFIWNTSSTEWSVGRDSEDYRKRYDRGALIRSSLSGSIGRCMLVLGRQGGGLQRHILSLRHHNQSSRLQLHARTTSAEATSNAKLSGSLLPTRKLHHSLINPTTSTLSSTPLTSAAHL